MVLILVLVEHTLGVSRSTLHGCRLKVLILVLVEHTLGGLFRAQRYTAADVLILVLVEHTLGVKLFVCKCKYDRGLNPCFSGTYSRRIEYGVNENETAES